VALQAVRHSTTDLYFAHQSAPDRLPCRSSAWKGKVGPPMKNEEQTAARAPEPGLGIPGGHGPGATKLRSHGTDATVFLQKVPQSQKLTCAANTCHSNKVADFQPKPGDILLIFMRTSKTGVDHHASGAARGCLRMYSRDMIRIFTPQFTCQPPFMPFFMTWRWLQLLESTRVRLGQRHGALLPWVGNTAAHVPMSVIRHWLTRSTAEAPVLQASERSGTDIFGNSGHQQFSTCCPLRRFCGPERPLVRKDGPRDHFCSPAGALSSAVFLTMPPIEGKRARTCLACANALSVVCAQLID